MFRVYLTDITDDDAEPVDLFVFEDRDEAHGLCTVLQPFLRDDIEAHFVPADEVN